MTLNKNYWEYSMPESREKENFTKQRVSLVEELVTQYPKGLEGWRFYRIEYGGHAENCIKECGIWMPPTIYIDDLEWLLNDQ